MVNIVNAGQRIKELRKEKRITQTDLANGVHVTQQTVTAWESGRAVPNASTLDALADYFNVSSDYILGRTNTKNPESKDLDDAFDHAMSFGGLPITEHDKKAMRNLWEAYLASKE